jgi:hypothetical protein
MGPASAHIYYVFATTTMLQANFLSTDRPLHVDLSMANIENPDSTGGVVAADIENANPNGSVVAVPKPSRHAVWNGRLEAIISGNPNGPSAGAEDVAVAEPVKRSRWWILCSCEVIGYFTVIAAIVLLGIQAFWPMGRARVAMIVVGAIALFVGGGSVYGMLFGKS